MIQTMSDKQVVAYCKPNGKFEGIMRKWEERLRASIPVLIQESKTNYVICKSEEGLTKMVWTDKVNEYEFVGKMIAWCHRRPPYRPPGDRITAGIGKGGLVVDANVVRQLLRNEGCKLDVHTTDARYMVLPRETWNRILAKDDTNAAKYIKEEYDCDNFALELYREMVNVKRLRAIGWMIDYSGKHSYNAILVLDKDGSVCAEFLEPQSDRIVEPGTPMSKTEMYTMQRGIVVF